MKSQIQLLSPRPQRAELLSETLSLPVQVRISADGDARSGLALARLKDVLGRRGVTTRFVDFMDQRADIDLQIEPDWDAKPESYELDVSSAGIRVRSKDAAGLFYAVTTLEQLLKLHTNGDTDVRLPGVRIADHPDFPQRGVMLDVSRDKVPTMATLFELVDMLASFKINQFQLYMEHTFAYAGHDVVWKDASPLTPAEIRELDAYCRERFIELVPNQNSFGHMHRWVIHEPYRSFAECPNGFEHPWNHTGEPYSLSAVDPRSLALIEDLYDQLLPNFQSKLFNVGCDETIDLGLGDSKAACEERGTTRVYLEFLNKIYERVTARGHRMQFWGDIIIKSPELIPELPKDAIALEWGYEANHPFRENVERFKASNLEFYVCPGTSSWNSIAGRTDNAVLNLCRAARAGVEYGATGYLNTDWGDNGHMQPLAVSYLGFLVGAGVSWNANDAVDATKLDVPALLDAHVFRDASKRMGRFVFDLGNVYQAAGNAIHNTSPLFSILNFPLTALDLPGLTVQTLRAARQKLSTLRDAKPTKLERADAALLDKEFSWTIDILTFACDLGLARLAIGADKSIREIEQSTRHKLAHELGDLIERHRANWLARNRPGGLRDSTRRLENIQQLLAFDR